MKLTLIFCIVNLFVSKSFSQSSGVAISGIIKDKANKSALPYVNVIIKQKKDSTFISGTVSAEDGRFSLVNIKPGDYYLEVTFVGYFTKRQSLYVGNLSNYLDLKTIEIEEDVKSLKEAEVTAKQDEVGGKMDKKSYTVEDNVSQGGGSVMQAMSNLPGVTAQDGQIQLRGNNRVTVLIDGKQTALTGFGNQSGLDNIPASAIERIEIINNPSAKYDANGNAGIINIIFKKEKKEGFNGKAGLAGGLGALWVRKENLPTVNAQYTLTPKINPSLSLNYRKKKMNAFFQGDYLYTQTLNKNEFITRKYDDGTIIKQQTRRNRNTGFLTLKTGLDYNLNAHNSFTISALFGSEKIIDHGEQVFFNDELSKRLRMWKFLEDELKTTVMATATYQHKFKQAGHTLNIGYNYTFHRENEKYFFDNIMPTFTGKDAFKLLSDEQVSDFNIDYIKPLKYGRIETGFKLRNRIIPTNMQFIPGINSPLDTNAGGSATYNEIIPALYGTYIYESKKIEAEMGLRLEYVDLKYDVNPLHNTYKSNGYSYSQPFPNLRFAYKINDHHKISIFYNRRVDRPNEVDIRIFPKYDDAEIIKVGNPALKPQFTNSFELSQKSTWKKGYFYSSVYYRLANGTITRIASTVEGSKLIYSVFQNAGKSVNTGLEFIVSQDVTKVYTCNANFNIYYNQIDSFSVTNKYPKPKTYHANRQEMISGNLKINNIFHFAKSLDAQITAIYLARDIIPQGNIWARFSLDVGVKKQIQKGKGEVYFNATDILNTLVIRKEIFGDGFGYTSSDYYETQVIRLGYNYKF